MDDKVCRYWKEKKKLFLNEFQNFFPIFFFIAEYYTRLFRNMNIKYDEMRDYKVKSAMLRVFVIYIFFFFYTDGINLWMIVKEKKKSYL